jgi:hypothetical protein
MSDLKFALTMTRTIEYTYEFEMNEKHAENAIAKYGSMLEYKQSKNDLNRALFGNRARTHETEPDSYNDSEWKRRIYPDEWTCTVIEDEPKSYEVTIRGVVEKTISVEAIDAYEAELEARHIFENQDRPDISAAAGEMLKIEVVV